MKYSPDSDIYNSQSIQNNATDTIEKAKEIFTAIACLTFFPGIYFFFKLIMNN